MYLPQCIHVRNEINFLEPRVADSISRLHFFTFLVAENFTDTISLFLENDFKKTIFSGKKKNAAKKMKSVKAPGTIIFLCDIFYFSLFLMNPHSKIQQKKKHTIYTPVWEFSDKISPRYKK